MTPELKQMARTVAEKLLGWEYRSRATSGMTTGEPPHWRAPDGKKQYNPKNHLLTGNGMLEVMAALAALDYDVGAFCNNRCNPPCCATLTHANPKRQKSGVGDTVPDAVLRAAYEVCKDD